MRVVAMTMSTDIVFVKEKALSTFIVSNAISFKTSQNILDNFGSRFGSLFVFGQLALCLS